MAQHDLARVLDRILAAGGTREQLLAADDRIQEIGGQIIAWNRGAESVALQLATDLENAAAEQAREEQRRAARVAKQQSMFTAVASGRTIYTKTPNHGWMILGPAADVVAGHSITVHKADGTTDRVTVNTVSGTATKHDVAYAMATFTKHPDPFALATRKTRGRCDNCHHYGQLTTVHDGSGLPGDVCDRCADVDPLELCFG